MAVTRRRPQNEVTGIRLGDGERLVGDLVFALVRLGFLLEGIFQALFDFL